MAYPRMVLKTCTMVMKEKRAPEDLGHNNYYINDLFKLCLCSYLYLQVQ